MRPLKNLKKLLSFKINIVSLRFFLNKNKYSKYIMTRKIILVISIVLSSTLYSFSQNGFDFDNPSSPYLNPITTSVPFLQIAPDSRGAGLGDIGVASSSDINSQHYNAAKYVFNKNKFGISMSYSPWLQDLIGDISLAYIAGFYKIDDMSAISMSLRYFSMGSIQFTDYFGEPIGERNPHEYAIDFAYSRKFTDHFSMAVTPRFIYSNLATNIEVSGIEMKPGIAGAADVSLFYEQDFKSSKYENQTFRAGLCISNIGNKISYTNGSLNRDFLPTNLRIGASYTMDIDKYNKISFLGEVGKLLVPTNPVKMVDEYGTPLQNVDGSYVYYGNGMDTKNIGVMQGILRSFYDSPGGFNEEMREIVFAVGTEYAYNDLFMVRLGTFFENKYKGNRKYGEVGVGFKYNVFAIDVSYLIAFTQHNPLENTLRFTLALNFESLYAKDIKKQGKK